MKETKKILVVEDDPMVGDVLNRMLSRQGYAATLSETAKDALHEAASDFFHLAILDIGLPDMEGTDLIPKLKTLHPDIAIMIVTGETSANAAIKALNIGADYYFRKPLNFGELTASLKAAMAKQALQIENRRLSNELKTELGIRKKTERKLRKSERRLQKIIDKNIDGVLIVRSDGIIRFVNPAAETMLHRKSDDLIGEMFGFPMAGDESTELEIPVSTGEIRTVELRTVDISWEGEDAYLASLRDITDRKSAETAFRESEKKYRILFESSADALYIATGEGRFIDVNRSFLDLFGYTRDELMKLDSIRMYKDPEDRQRYLNAMMAHGYVKNETLVLQKKDGTAVDCLRTASVRRDEAGDIIGFQGIIRDITRYKIAEKKIRQYSKGLEAMVETRTQELNRALYDTEEARDKIDGILKSVGDGLIVTDMYNRVVQMNRAAEDLLEVRLSEVLDRPVDFAIQDETLRRKVKDTFKKKKSGYEFDFRLDPPGSKIPNIMRARTSVIEDREGKPSGIVTIIHDVTHEREVDRMKSEFISTAAHELRTPLTSIRGFSELLLTRKDLPPAEREKFLSYVNRQAEHLSRIVGDLLDLSRMEAGGGFGLTQKTCQVADLFRDQISYFRSISDGHSIEMALTDETQHLLVDKEKIEQCIANLLSNAVKYSPDGGKIRISGECDEKWYRLSVADEGIGMTREQAEKVFDKFYRVDASDSAPVGTGLGMTIVKHIIEAHGGKVWAESEPDKGTVIHFTLPMEGVTPTMH